MNARASGEGRPRLAKVAEDAAAEYVASLGWRILRRNLYGTGGEIDIVALDGATVVFIEVKARETRTFGSALSAVDARKRARIRAIAADFLQVVARNARARFDVVAFENGKLRHYRNAF